MKPGLYEALVTEELAAALAALDPAAVHVERGQLDPGDAHILLARHVQRVLERSLKGHPAEQAALVNRLLAVLADADSAAVDGEQVAQPPERLREVALRLATGPGEPVARPKTPLDTSALLTNARGEPRIGTELRGELASADSVDLLCAFVRWQGVVVLEDALARYLGAGRPLRVITTTYMGATERRALDRLAELGATIRVAYESQVTRLHAKAWLFTRESGYTTAFIGSSNLSRSALLDGLEWNVRVAQAESPHLIAKFRATFDTYWESALFEPYEPARDKERLDRALATTRTPESGVSYAHLDIQPRPHQREMLEKLRTERERHDRWRSLVVAATGTGKTVVAALDYRWLRQRLGAPLRLLVVAHRREILEQCLGTFRAVLGDGAFGELYVDGRRPSEWTHVFASVQALQNVDLGSRDFDVVIVDEFHHAAATTYERLLGRLQPKVLLGLTATPERADGRSVTGWFDDHIAVELRLWEALDRQLLCPFQYFGVADNTDLSRLEWRAGGYAPQALSTALTGDKLRVAMVLKALEAKVHDVRTMRAIGFCASVEHARFMAEQFRQAGLASQAVVGVTPSDERDAAMRQLRDGQLRVIFTVDLYSEGVDLPEVDTLLMLRPTESATVFLQQLGRGLRWSEGKACCTVLDFIGQQHRRFRFDLKYRALTGASRAEVTRQLQEGFPYLPAGTHFELDRVASERVLRSIRQALPNRVADLARELQALTAARGAPVGLAAFLRESALEPEDLYRSGANSRWSWTGIRREAGLDVRPEGAHEETLLRGVSRLLHVADPERCAFYARVLGAHAPPDMGSLSEREHRMLLMLHFTLRGPKAAWPDLPSALADLWAHGTVLDELRELVRVLDARSETLEGRLALRQEPLHVHAHYRREEILAAFGGMRVERPNFPREGVWYHEPTRTDVFFVTLQKTEQHYSATTLYRDYPVSPTLFHWESQSTTTPESRTGRRYLEHRASGGHVWLFARQNRADARGMTAPYLFLGPAHYVKHTGSRPISFTWRLEQPMPQPFFEQGKVVGG